MTKPDPDFPHQNECEGTWCDFCGCCAHGEDDLGCRIEDAPDQVPCPNPGCFCIGKGFYDPPSPPPEVLESPEGETLMDAPQLHQEVSLFPEDWEAALS